MLLAASLAVSMCATPVFADYDMGKQNGSKDTGAAGLTTNVYYEVTGGYLWSVPSTIDFGKDAGAGSQTRIVEANLEEDKEGVAANKNNDNKNGTAPKVTVTKNVIDPGKSLKISLKAADSATEFKVKTSKDGTDATLGYAVKTTNAKIDGADSSQYTNLDVNATGTQILELTAGVNTGEVDLKFTLTTTVESAEIAGQYKGQVVFTADATTATNF